MLYSPAERFCACVRALTLRALFSFSSGLLCVCILLGVFCAIIRRGREQGNAALFIHTAVNSSAASSRLTCSGKLPASRQRAHFTFIPSLAELLLPVPSCQPSPGIWPWGAWHSPIQTSGYVKVQGTTLGNVRAVSLHGCSAALITKSSSGCIML